MTVLPEFSSTNLSHGQSWALCKTSLTSQRCTPKWLHIRLFSKCYPPPLYVFGFFYDPFAPGPHQALFYSQKCIINNSTLYQLFCNPKEAFWSSGYSNITDSFFFKTHYNKFTWFKVKNIPLSVNLIDSLCESIFRANPVTQSIERLLINPENHVVSDLWYTCVSMKLCEYLKCQILVNKAWLFTSLYSGANFTIYLAMICARILKSLIFGIHRHIIRIHVL